MTVIESAGPAALPPWPPAQRRHRATERGSLHCDASLLGNAAILRLAGRLDATTAPQLARAVRRLLDADIAVLVVDLLDLFAIGPAGPTALVAATRDGLRRGSTTRILADRADVLDPLRGCRELDVCDLRGGAPGGRA